MELIRTGLSPAFWCVPEEGYQFDTATISGIHLRNVYKEEEQRRARGELHGAVPDRQTCWLDHLLEGGIVIPDSRGPAITILLAGPPGTGKTILATELCYRLAKTAHWRCLYVTSEATEERLIENARDLGWDRDDTNPIFHVLSPSGPVPPGRVSVFRSQDGRGVLPAHKNGVTPGLGQLLDYLDVMLGITKRTLQSDSTPTPQADVLVVDSLNTSPDFDSATWSELLNRVAGRVAKILIVVLDSWRDDPDAPHAFWEYASDIIVRLDCRRDLKTNYLLRTLQIVKARFQQHAWGEHQLKIYEKPDIELPATAGFQPNDRKVTELMRSHPHRKEGGVYVFPSIHFFLSKYKRRTPTDTPGEVRSAIDELNQLLPKGYPGGRCTALIGGRGSYKSHLGYLEMLWRIIESARSPTNDLPTKALVVSLRDDEGMTRATIQDVLNSEARLKQCDGQPHKATDLERQGRLEILYYPPGSITPEEFFHRLLITIHRLTRDGSQLSVLFNSVDQLGSNFPLCANEPLFVPGIVHMLSAEKVTSFFVAAQAPGQPQGLYGLESTAELMLAIERDRFDREKYFDCIDALRAAATAAPINRSEVNLTHPHWAVTVSVVRFPSGRRVGNKGFLELISDSEDDVELRKIFSQTGLHFAPSAPDPIKP